jgi:hypothetical protein
MSNIDVMFALFESGSSCEWSVCASFSADSNNTGCFMSKNGQSDFSIEIVTIEMMQKTPNTDVMLARSHYTVHFVLPHIQKIEQNWCVSFVLNKPWMLTMPQQQQQQQQQQQWQPAIVSTIIHQFPQNFLGVKMCLSTDKH